MRRNIRPNWNASWAEPDLDSLPGVEAKDLPFAGYTRRSFIPDGLSIVIAAESGKPILYPIFPINGFTPENGCEAHHGPIPSGSSAYCPCCHDTGLRAHTALQRDPATDPQPEPASPDIVATEPRKPQTPKTRKQRRAAQHKANHVRTSARSANAG